jgi:endonuclease-3
MTTPARPHLRAVVASLEALHGTPSPPAYPDPWEHILAENASYLVDDERKCAVLESLRREVGLKPASLLAAGRDPIAAAIRAGGMKPPMRAEKVLAAARVAEEVGPLGRVLAEPPEAAVRILRRFPSIGRPGAERVLLFAGVAPLLALDSNGVRVLLRLGFGTTQRNYDATWRSVTEEATREIPRDVAYVLRAHQLLRLHGRTLCLRAGPKSAECPLRDHCSPTRGSTHAPR